jgi:hypothetical protein
LAAAGGEAVAKKSLVKLELLVIRSNLFIFLITCGGNMVFGVKLFDGTLTFVDAVSTNDATILLDEIANADGHKIQRLRFLRDTSHICKQAFGMPKT